MTLHGKHRLAFVFGVLIVFLVGVGVRLWVVTFPDQEAVQEERAEPTAVDRPRAKILDRHGRILALSIASHSLYVNPSQIDDPEETFDRLSVLFPALEKSRLMPYLENRRLKEFRIKKHLTPQELRALTETNVISSAFFRSTLVRRYPHANLYAHSIGLTNSEQIPVMGLEKDYNDALTTQAEIKTTFDTTLQYILRDHLLDQMTEFQAKSAGGAILNIRNGDILALVSLPDFDPNDLTFDISQASFFNHMTQGRYELGSVLKIFNTALAFESDHIGEDETFDVRNEIERPGFTPIMDFVRAPKELYDIAEILIYSSNIGSARLSLRIGGENQKNFFSRVGLIDPMSLGRTSLMSPAYPSSWRRSRGISHLDTMAVSYGYSLAINPVHFAVVVGGILNQGTSYKPRLLLEEPVAHHRTDMVSPETSNKLKRLLRQVVVRGTGTAARVDGVKVSGKTGTANLVIDGEFDLIRQRCSFISVFPSDEPEYLVFIMVEEPEEKEYVPYLTGGTVAAPVAQKVIAQATPYLQLPFSSTEQSLEDFSLERAHIERRLRFLEQRQ